MSVTVINTTMKNLSEKELSDKIIREFASELRKRLGDRIQQIILYGSRARGDFWEGSDFDFLILIKNKDPELRERVLDVEVDLLDRYEHLVTSQILTEEQWDRERYSPWGRNIEKEGVRM